MSEGADALQEGADDTLLGKEPPVKPALHPGKRVGNTRRKELSIMVLGGR